MTITHRSSSPVLRELASKPAGFNAIFRLRGADSWRYAGTPLRFASKAIQRWKLLIETLPTALKPKAN